MERIKSDYLRNVKHLQISDAVYTTLKESIVRNQLDSTFRLKEEELASTLNISRTPIREALQHLEQNDYIISDRKKGYIVKSLSINESIDIIEYVHFLRRFAAVITAHQITKQQVLFLEQKKLTEMQLRSLNDPAQVSNVYKCHQEFHLSIARLTNNNFLYNESIRMHEKLLMIHYYYTSAMKSDFPAYLYLQEHEKLLEAFRDHDSKKAKEIVDEYSKNACIVIKRMYKLKRNFD
ncbi:DNA-binding transcriptional regulator, GntR family [Desulfotomaculum arcticum]|uniref:DNA-binding transcriptional regulator, GntR family n=1 Tax=Desulfotruncus arcticus DSM 17038 TaxID=1121424 RepID=A0A1I2NX19_9FIRM|nr:GntR family transcriptional regulator [Desulfotruncus arcticus]SFG08475.1 DNA-binding transcriptional regulator, GntR family [Desulfotomaculum arcticum] [Desulfotruncus arcticus DSM 17038]